jgi:hypothetical protein
MPLHPPSPVLGSKVHQGLPQLALEYLGVLSLSFSLFFSLSLFTLPLHCIYLPLHPSLSLAHSLSSIYLSIYHPLPLLPSSIHPSTSPPTLHSNPLTPPSPPHTHQDCRFRLVRSDDCAPSPHKHASLSKCMFVRLCACVRACMRACDVRFITPPPPPSPIIFRDVPSC